uniref:Uncharacterized protein n=1 Tax=Physcomitrium patens TaxID=3218 RepID=A0A7I4D7H8_PHYPA
QLRSCVWRTLQAETQQRKWHSPSCFETTIAIVPDVCKLLSVPVIEEHEFMRRYDVRGANEDEEEWQYGGFRASTNVFCMVLSLVN